MITVVFMADAIVSHAYSSLGVARRLSRRGMAVEYWGVSRNNIDRLIECQGFKFRHIDGVWSRYVDETRLPTDMTVFNFARHVPSLIRKFKARRQWMRRLPAALDQFEGSLDRLLQTRLPTFVVLDPFLLAYYPYFHARGLPTVVLSTKPLPIRDPYVPPYDSRLMPRQTAIGRTLVGLSWARPIVRDTVLRLCRSAMHWCRAYTYQDILLHAARRTAFPLDRELVRRWLQPDLNFRSVHEWALWTAETDLPRQRQLPSNTHYIGPSVDIGRTQPSVSVPPRSARYRVYVAVGTIRFRWRDNVPFLRKVLRAFADLPDFEVVISTGDERATKALGSPPANIRVLDFVPQLRILDDVDLVITHGGAGTFRECVEKQVPMLAYSRNHDQIGNAVRIAYHQVGLRGHRGIDSPATIRRKAMTILSDPGYRERLRRLRDATHCNEDALLTRALEALDLDSVVEYPVASTGAVTSGPTVESA